MRVCFGSFVKVGDFEASFGRDGQSKWRTERRLERTDRRHRVIEDLLREADALLGAEVLAVRRRRAVIVVVAVALRPLAAEIRLVVAGGEVRQSGVEHGGVGQGDGTRDPRRRLRRRRGVVVGELAALGAGDVDVVLSGCCLLYTSPSPRDRTRSRMPSSA